MGYFPVLLILGYLSTLGIRRVPKDKGQSPGNLFCHGDDSPLTRSQFWSVTSKTFGKAGISGWKFGTHSFRIGTASTTAALGYGVDQIKGVGLWTSQSYKSYIRPLPQ